MKKVLYWLMRALPFVNLLINHCDNHILNKFNIGNMVYTLADRYYTDNPTQSGNIYGDGRLYESHYHPCSFVLTHACCNCDTTFLDLKHKGQVSSLLTLSSEHT